MSPAIQHRAPTAHGRQHVIVTRHPDGTVRVTAAPTRTTSWLAAFAARFAS